MSADLARVAGPVGAAGLVVLMLAPARYQRLGGLAAWAIGAGVLAAYLAPSGHVALLGAAAVAGLLLAAAGAYVLRRWPWLLALATLACVPARIPVTIGSTEANLLVPLYAVVAAAALALAWDFVRGDERRRELGPVLHSRWPSSSPGPASRSHGARTCVRARSSCSRSTSPSA